MVICGEVCHLLWEKVTERRQFGSKKLGNQLAKKYDVDIMCGYSLRRLQGGMDSHIFERICAEHSALYSQ